MTTSPYNINDLEEHTQALANIFAAIGDAKGYSTDDLVSIRNRVVEERGKYDANWKDDPEEKLAFDYYYCIEMLHYIRTEYELSEKRRERLYRMATWNEDVAAVFALDKYWDPKAFLDDEQYAKKAWKKLNPWPKKKSA